MTNLEKLSEYLYKKGKYDKERIFVTQLNNSVLHISGKIKRQEFYKTPYGISAIYVTNNEGDPLVSLTNKDILEVQFIQESFSAHILLTTTDKTVYRLV